MNRLTSYLFLATALLSVAACATQRTTSDPAPISEAVRGDAVKPIDPLRTLIGQALANDKRITRAYLVEKDPNPSSPVYVLAPIFEESYPQEAINAAYKTFYSIVPNGKLELLLVPKRDYKKHFGQSEPIYVRP